MYHQRPRRFIVAVIFLALAWISVPAPHIDAQQPDGYVPGEVVVKLQSPGDLPSVAQTFGLAPTPLSQFGSRAIYRLRILDGTDPAAKAAALAGDSRILYAEPNYLGETPEGRQDYSWAGGGDAGGYSGQYASMTMRLPAAHQATRGRGVTVAVLDTGVDRAHPALAGRLLPGRDFVDFDNDPSEVGVHGQNRGFGHGTHVAGLVALSAPEASILPVRVLDPNGVGNIWVLAEALLYAVDPDGQPGTNDGAIVINLSLGTTRRTQLLDEIVAAVTCADDDDDDDDDDDGNEGAEDDDDCTVNGGRGAVVLIAAGNSGGSIPEYPAAEAVPGSLATAASTQADTLAPFSTHGPWVLAAAPGDRILSSVPGGGYGTWSGTSMAAPLAAGTAALVRATDQGMTAIAVVDRLVQTARPIPGPVPARIDAASAVGR